MSHDLVKFLLDSDVRDEVLKIGFNLCPTRDLGARQNYAGNLLDWLEDGDSPESRYSRLCALRRVYWTRVADHDAKTPIKIELDTLLGQLAPLVAFIERGDR